jgi:hypothetical protein
LNPATSVRIEQGTAFDPESDEYPIWYVYAENDEEEMIGTFHTCHSEPVAQTLARTIAAARGIAPEEIHRD